MSRTVVGIVSLAVAAAVWLPCAHLLFCIDTDHPYEQAEVLPRARELAEWHLGLWTDPASRSREVERMRRSNAEWDFMGRSFLVWALAEVALREPSLGARVLPVMDRIIDETIRLQEEKGLFHFLMPYARRGPFVQQPPRSLFLDGETAMMLAARRAVAEKEAYREALAELVDAMVARMEASPTLSAESYPDECWLFCNTVALAAIRLADHLDGTDHSALFRRWVEVARSRLVHPQTGLLLSAYTLNGRPLQGPEGSSIWLAAHCLRLIDEGFAEDQYRRARAELGRSLLGFGYAREWPESWVGVEDVDSGPVVPVLGGSFASSGLALVAAASFGDGEFWASLIASLDFLGFPRSRGGRLRYCASNQVGDAVLLYAHVLGPLWSRAYRERQP